MKAMSCLSSSEDGLLVFFLVKCLPYFLRIVYSGKVITETMDACAEGVKVWYYCPSPPQQFCEYVHNGISMYICMYV